MSRWTPENAIAALRDAARNGNEASPEMAGAINCVLSQLAAVEEKVRAYEAAIKACHGLTTQYGTLVKQEFFEIRFTEAGTSKGYWLVYNSFAEIISPEFDTALDAWCWLTANRGKFVPHGKGFMGAHLAEPFAALREK